VLYWRVLQKLPTKGWAQDLRGQLYLDKDTRACAQDEGTMDPTLDSNKKELQVGESRHLIKNLDIKGLLFELEILS
jgi:uncharacterized Zn ribbon protein